MEWSAETELPNVAANTIVPCSPLERPVVELASVYYCYHLLVFHQLYGMGDSSVIHIMLGHKLNYSPRADGTGVELPALDRDMRNVDVLAVVADADESFRELDKFESCDVFRVINHDECRRRGSSIRNGMPQ